MGGLFSSLIGTDYRPYYAYALDEIREEPHAIVMPLVVGYENWLSGIAKQVKAKWPRATLIGFTITQGLAGSTSHSHLFDRLVGYDTIPEMAKVLGVDAEYFPEIKTPALPDKQFVPWLLTATGCVARCYYCTWAARPMRWRSPENTMRSLYAMFNPRSKVISPPVYLMLSEMNANPKWMRKLAELKENSLLTPLSIVTDVRADWLTEEHVDLLKRMKCVEVIAAVESPNPEILAAIDRKMDLDKFVRGYKMLQAAGIKVMCPMLFGMDEREDPVEYADFCKKHGVQANPGIMKLYPGTPAYQKMKNEGWQTESFREWDDPAEPLLVRKGLAVAQEKLRKFQELMM